MAWIAWVFAAATEKEQPESFVDTRYIFDEAGQVCLDSEVGVTDQTGAELANPGELIQVLQTNSESLPTTHGEPRDGAIVTSRERAIILFHQWNHVIEQFLTQRRESFGCVASGRIAFAVRHHDNHRN